MAITKLYGTEKKSNSEALFDPEDHIYPFDSDAASQLPLGISKRREIQAQGIDKGLLTYRVKKGYQTLLFNYHDERQKITIPL